MEVKSVTLRCTDGAGAFPDAVSARTSEHLLESQPAMERGDRAALVFAVLLAVITRVAPAQDIDPIYASALRQAMARGWRSTRYSMSLLYTGSIP